MLVGWTCILSPWVWSLVFLPGSDPFPWGKRGGNSTMSNRVLWFRPRESACFHSRVMMIGWEQSESL